MYGVVTRNEEEVRWPEFDRGFYEVKDVTGRSAEPIADGVNMVSCFGDNAASDADPSLVPVDDLRRPRRAIGRTSTGITSVRRVRTTAKGCSR